MAQPKRIAVVTTGCDHLDATHPTGLWFEERAAASPYLSSRGKAARHGTS
jgi:hypothetical protein